MFTKLWEDWPVSVSQVLRQEAWVCTTVRVWPVGVDGPWLGGNMHQAHKGAPRSESWPFWCPQL